MVLTGVKIYRDKSDVSIDYTDIFNEYQNADYMKLFVWSLNQEPRMTSYPVELSEHRNYGEDEMLISVQGGGHTIMYRLNDTPAAHSLYDQFPLTVDVENYGSNEKIFYPDTKLDTTDAVEGAGGAGGLAYFSPWGNVVMYYDSFGQYAGLYILGAAVSGTEYISELTGTITVEKADTVMTEYEYTTQELYFDNGGKSIYFAILDPEYTMTMPLKQVISGSFDTLSHCMETYLGTPRDTNLTDEINEAVMRSVIKNLRATLKNPDDKFARSLHVWQRMFGVYRTRERRRCSSLWRALTRLQNL